jgi:hypothetical protein
MVECIGTSAAVSLWQIENLPRLKTQQLAKYRGFVMGNDAVIVAHELLSQGISASCCLLNPTSADVLAVRNYLGADRVRVVDESVGARTQSLCFEDTTGARYWLFSRTHSPSGSLGQLTADIVYMDFYPELFDFFDQARNSAELARCTTIVNLSLVRDPTQIPELSFRPSVIQASVLEEVNPSDSLNFARRLLDKSEADMAFVTLGARGATVACRSEGWHVPAQSVLQRTILGAGAVFSSSVAVGMVQGYSCRELLEFSVVRTAKRLQLWREHEDFRT